VQLAKKMGAGRAIFTGAIKTDLNKSILLNDDESRDCRLDILRSEKLHQFPVQIVSSLGLRNGIEFCRGLNQFDISVNSKGEVFFCCDNIGEGAVAGSLKERTFFELYERCLDWSLFLKKKRLEMLARNETMEGFNTCEFCNAFLGDHFRRR
jgi:hypothetical protein